MKEEIRHNKMEKCWKKARRKRKQLVVDESHATDEGQLHSTVLPSSPQQVLCTFTSLLFMSDKLMEGEA